MSNLRQGTAATIKLGPFLDADDFSALTGLTIQKAHVRVSKNGGAYAAASADQGASDAGAAHDEGGEYAISLDADDTDTTGRLRVMIQMSGALPVFREYDVRAQVAYDALVEGSEGLMIDAEDVAEAVVTELGTGSSLTALASASALATVAGYVDTEVASILSGVNTLVSRLDADRAGYLDNLAGGAVALESTVGALNDLSAADVRTQADAALAAVGLDGFSDLVEDDDGTIRFTAHALEESPTGSGGSGGGLDAAGVRAAIGLDAANLDDQLAALATTEDLDALDTVIDRIEDDTTDIQSRLPTALVGGRMASDLGSVAGDPLAAGDIMGMLAAILTHTGTTLNGKLDDLANAIAGQNNLSASQARAQIDAALASLGLGAFANLVEGVGEEARFRESALELAPTGGMDAAGVRTALGLATGNLDTQLSALPNSTANAVIAASQENRIHANIREVNDVDIQGTGQNGDLWRPAT